MKNFIPLLLFTISFTHCNAQEWTEFSAVLKPSPIHGIGVFVTHDIPKGTKVFNEQIKYRWYKLDTLPVELRKYCQYLTEGECRGPERFDRMEVDWYLNHSDNPNVIEVKEDYWVAERNIKAGEELLIDYNQLNEPEHLKESFYKKSNK